MTAEVLVTLDDLSESWAPGVAPWLDRLDMVHEGLFHWQERWRDDGFLILHGLFEDFFDCGRINDYCDAWRADNAGAGWERPMGWPYNTPYMHVPELHELVCDGLLSEFLEEAIGEPMGVHLNLTGWRSTQRNWHQDGYLNPDTTADHYAAVWIALDNIHPDSGPFQYVPGSHREFPVIRHDKMRAALRPDEQGPDWPTHSERILTPLFEQAIAERGLEVREFIAEKGDVLIWHPRLLHRGSTPRDPSLERRALIAHYSGIHHRPDMPAAVQHGTAGWFFPINEGGHR